MFKKEPKTSENVPSTTVYMAYSLMDVELRALYPRSAKYLLWNVFLRDSMRGLKLWLSMGYGAAEMQLPMLFMANESGLVKKSVVVERMKYAHSNLMFLPEQIEMGCVVNIRYSGICSDEIVRALRIIRCRHLLEEDQIKEPKDMDSQVLSQRIRTQAAILSDDKGWLGGLAAEPDFEFSSEQLAFAARYGSIECFRFISINGAEYKQSVIEAAVYGGNEEIIQMCLEHGCDVRTEEVMRQSVRGCQTKVLEWLVEVHDMEPTSDVLATALMSGNYDVVVRFGPVLHESDTIKFGQWNDSDLPRNDDFRHFVVHLLDDPCVRANLKDCIMSDTNAILYCDDVELANKCGVDINRFESILFAAQNGCTCILNTISQNGTIDAIDRTGETALIRCAREGIIGALFSLVEHGANVEAVDKDRSSALIRAAENGHIDAVRYLFEHGANVDAVNKYSWTPMMRAVLYDHTDIVKYLVEHGANAAAVDKYGITTLMHAASYGRTDIVEYLVEQGANLEAVDENGMAALMIAAVRGRTDIVEYLVEQGANLEAVDEDGCTILMRAADFGHTDIVKYLVEQGANVEAADKDDRTALMFAADNGHAEITKYLVQQGAATYE